MELSVLYNEQYSVTRQKCNIFIRQRITAQRFRQILKVVTLTKRDRVLEVGCDEGILLRSLERTGATVHGIDVNPHAVQKAEHPHIQPGSAEHIPFPDGSFTACIASHVIEHLQSPRVLLSEVSRVLVPGGKLVLIYPWELFQGMSVIPEVIRSGRPLSHIRRFHRHVMSPHFLKECSKELPLRHVVSRMFWGWPHATPQYITVFQRTHDPVY